MSGFDSTGCEFSGFWGSVLRVDGSGVKGLEF